MHHILEIDCMFVYTVKGTYNFSSKIKAEE